MDEMSVLVGLGVLGAAALAFANGANDVSKAIATLVGSGEARVRTAVAWGTFWTVAGALVGTGVAVKLVRLFTDGLLEPGAQLGVLFAAAVMVGAVTWIGVASWRGWPISTTHALAGAVVSVAAVAFGVHQVAWSAVVMKVLLPLACAPLLALPVTLVVGALLPHLPLAQNNHGLHWLSAGTVSFARGLNDAPKIVGVAWLYFVATGGDSPERLRLVFLVVATAMGIGSAVGGRNVLRLLAHDVTSLTHAQGVSANVATALLVLLASRAGFPVSTTHVTGCAIMSTGINKVGRRLNRAVVRDIALAWITTAPAAGLVAAASYVLMNAAQN